MKLQTKITATLAAIAMGAMATFGLVAAAPSSAVTPTAPQGYLGAVPTIDGTVHCWSYWLAAWRLDGTDSELFCNKYNFAGALVEQVLHMNFNYENCDGQKMVFAGPGESYLDVWNAESDFGLEHIDEHGHRGGCARGNWQGTDDGIAVSFPEGTNFLHGTLKTFGLTAQQDICGLEGWLPDMCPGIGRSIRIFFR